MQRSIATILFTALFIGFAQGQTSPEDALAKLKERQVQRELPTTLPSNKSTDVLALIDTEHDSVQGQWARDGTSIRCASAGREDRLRFPVHLDGSYQLDLTLQRTIRAGDTAVFFELPVGKATAALWLDYWGGRSSGLSKINGKSHEKNSTRVNGVQLDDKRSNDVTIRVTTKDVNAEVSVKLNGRDLLRWQGPQTALVTDIEHVQDGLYVGVVLNSITISKCSLTAASGEYRLLRQSDSNVVAALPSATAPTSTSQVIGSGANKQETPNSPLATSQGGPQISPTLKKDEPPNAQLIGPSNDAIQGTITQAEIKEFKEAKLQAVRDQIKKLQSLVSMLPKNRTSPSAVEGKLYSAKADEVKILAQSDASIAQEITEARAKALAEANAQRIADKQRELMRQQEALAQQQAAQAASQRRAAALSRQFPGWNGPWKQCPFCGGSGRDSDAERAINTRNGGIMASQNFGHGQVQQMPGAFVPCKACGGGGRVPDMP